MQNMMQAAFWILGFLPCFRIWTSGLTCPQDYSQYETAQKCIKMIPTLVSRDEGQELCEEDGGNLASVLSEDEADYLVDNIPAYKLLDSYYWVGLTDIVSEERFLWADGTALGWTYWQRLPLPQPNNYNNQDCVAALGSFFFWWDDRPCSERNRVLCQWKPSPLTVATAVQILTSNGSPQTTMQAVAEESTSTSTPAIGHISDSVLTTIQEVVEVSTIEEVDKEISPAITIERIRSFVPTVHEAPGAVAVGILGIIGISLLIGCVVLSDMTTIKSHCLLLKNNIVGGKD